MYNLSLIVEYPEIAMFTPPRKTPRSQFVALAFWLVGGASFVAAQQLPLKSYTTADGMAHNGVNLIVKDSRGFLWFCTEEGLSRFDGYTFTNYGVEQGLPHRVVTDFLETRAGEFWVATYGGLVRFNPQGAPAPCVVYSNEAARPAPMFTVVVPADEDRYARATKSLLESRDGALWIGTMKHLYRLERQGGRFDLLPLDIGIVTGQTKQVYVLDLLEDRHGSLWVASFNGLFRRRPDGRTEQYTKRDGLPDDNIHDLLEDRQGRLWAGTRLGGFFRFTTNETSDTPFVAQKYVRRDGLPTDWVFQLYETSDRRFWVATNKGLVEFFPDGDAPGRYFRAYTRRNGLSFHEIAALVEDTGGNLWLGTNTAGAMRLARNGFTTYSAQDGLLTVHAIFEDEAGGICFRGAVLGDQRGSAFDGAKLDLLRAGADTFFSRFGRFDGQRFDWFKPAIPFALTTLRRSGQPSGATRLRRDFPPTAPKLSPRTSTAASTSRRGAVSISSTPRRAASNTSRLTTAWRRAPSSPPSATGRARSGSARIAVCRALRPRPLRPRRRRRY